MADGRGRLSDEEFETLVKEHKDRVYNVALSFLRNTYDADEVAQDVFVEVWQSIDSFKGQSSLSTWIYRITVHKCLDLIRSRKRKKRFAWVVSLLGDEKVAAGASTEFDHPGVSLEQKENARLLFDAIDRLPEKQRVAYSLHNLEGLSYEQISEVLQTSISAVESLIFRAKKELREILSEHFKKNASFRRESRLT